MNRIEIAQTVLDATGNGNYLEIGVASGESFIPLRASRKWGVDPSHCLSWKRLAKYRLFALLQIRDERIFRQTSDEFFANHQRLLRRRGIDVSFVDGLHTYEQALRDVDNCLGYLNPNGVILIHDCNPETEIAAFPAGSIEEVATGNFPGWTGAWNGEVWKAVVHLRSLRDHLNVFVLDCDQGVGVVTRGHPGEKLSHSAQEIREMDYGFLEKDRERLLGLRPPEYIHEFLQSRGR